VPLAAAICSRGISFGGGISFLVAALIDMPLILICRKFYGPKVTLRIVGLFYVLMATAGLATEGIFRLFHAVPTTRSLTVTPAHFQWNYTTYLNIFFILLAVAVYWLSKNKRRFGGGDGYAIDPVCGMQVRISDAPATAIIDGTTHYFCSDRCHDRYTAGVKNEPTSKVVMPIALMAQPTAPVSTSTAIDPVCGMTVDTAHAAATRDHDSFVRQCQCGVTYYFCNPGCATTFDANPDQYIHHEGTP
jgi:YHS domain-containing protein